MTCLVAAVVTRGTPGLFKGRDGYAPLIARVIGPNRPSIPFQTQDCEIRKSRSFRSLRSHYIVNVPSNTVDQPHLGPYITHEHDPGVSCKEDMTI